MPVWVALLAWPVLGERPAAGVWLAVAAGVCGVALVQQPTAAGNTTAALLALGNALATAIAMLGLNRLGSLDARAVVVHFSGVSTAVTLAFLLFSRGAVEYAPLADPLTLLLLVGVGLTGTLGQLAMTRAFALGNAPRVSVVGLMQIVFAVCFDLLLWQRPFGLLTLAGILLVVAPSGWLMLHHPLRRQTPIHTTT